MEQLTADYQREVRELSGKVISRVEIKKRKDKELTGASKIFFLIFSSFFF
jgi:hypothetical protein